MEDKFTAKVIKFIDEEIDRLLYDWFSDGNEPSVFSRFGRALTNPDRLKAWTLRKLTSGDDCYYDSIAKLALKIALEKVDWAELVVRYQKQSQILLMTAKVTKQVDAEYERNWSPIWDKTTAELPSYKTWESNLRSQWKAERSAILSA